MRATAARTLSTSTGGKDFYGSVPLLFFLCAHGVLCGAALPESKLVDPTRPFNETAACWPAAQPFQWGRTAGRVLPGLPGLSVLVIR
jgi:hypothetical protein